jgi:hypothetical protein
MKQPYNSIEHFKLVSRGYHYRRFMLDDNNGFDVYDSTYKYVIINSKGEVELDDVRNLAEEQRITRAATALRLAYASGVPM